MNKQDIMNKLIVGKKHTMYARNSKAEIVQWSIYITKGLNVSYLCTEYGRYGGKLITKSYPIVEGKNIGKVNETDVFEQAIQESYSKIVKKIKEGYRKIYDLSKIEEELPLTRKDSSGSDKPMLAVKFKPGKTAYPAFIQPKLNGVRGELGIKVEQDGLFGDKEVVYLKSRDGNYYPIPDHIKTSYLNLIEKFRVKAENIIFDGEVYCHDMPLQKIVSAIKKHNEDTIKLRFVIYDIKANEPQVARINLLNSLFETYTDGCLGIVALDTVEVNSDEECEKFADECIDAGYEGAIVRNYHAPYQFGKRTKYLQKIKRVHDKEFILVDIIPSGNDLYNGQSIGMFVCKNDTNDLTFKVTPQATKKERYEYLQYKNRYIGRNITVFYRERTMDDIPFHANGIIRDYE